MVLHKMDLIRDLHWRGLRVAAKEKQSGFKVFLFLLYAVSFIIIIFIAYNSGIYYISEATDRIHMEVHDLYKPSGLIGHGLGIIGSTMMLLLLLYSVRKRFRVFRKLGKLSNWLHIHIFFGIIGPILVTLHTAFKFNGIVAVSFWSMVAVALSGFIGRYIYIQIPRNIHGNELSKKEMDDLNEEFNAELREKYGFTDEMIAEVDKIAKAGSRKANKELKAIFSLIEDDFTGAFKLRDLEREYTQQFQFPQKKMRALMKVTREKLKLEKRIQAWEALQNIFHYWHILHKPFAIIMLIIMVVHVTVAILFGYTWVF